MAAKFAAPEARSARFYLPELDELRFYAFLAVFFNHFLPDSTQPYTVRGASPELAHWFVGLATAGGYGVDLFFTLSSYLITILLIKERERTGQIHVKAFYIRRALRIWPLYFFFLAIIPLVSYFMRDEFSPVYLFTFWTFTGNWACALYGFPFSAVIILWSVSVEEQFYLAWPLLLRKISVRNLALWLLVVANVTRVILVLIRAHEPAFWCNTLARLDPIACGALLAVSGKVIRRRWIVLGIALFLLVGRYGELAGPISLISYPLAALASTLVLASFVGKRSNPALVYLGRISYGLYVFHLLIIRLVEAYLPSNNGIRGIILRFVPSLALTVIAAALSYELLESPFLRLKERFTWVRSRA